MLPLFLVVFNSIFCAATFAQNKIIQKQLTYKIGETTYQGYAAYDSSSQAIKRPVVLILPEWWGAGEYVKMRAMMLAKLGYYAFALDLYGNGKIAADVNEAKALSTPFYQNPKLAYDNINAAMAMLAKQSQADFRNTAAIGYCFGGSMLIQAVKMGLVLKGMVSFHAGLAGAPAEAGMIKTPMLICHGGADLFVSAEDVAAFRKNMDDVSAEYQFISYPNATHAFTNPQATAIGKKFNLHIAYNPEADKSSWIDMMKYLAAWLKN